MRRELLHICGPISIYSYGVAIAVGVLIFAWLIQRDSKYIQLNIGNKLIDILIASIITGVFGGRLLYILTEPEADKTFMSFLSFWEGGFSILGCILAILIIMPWFLKRLHIPIIPFLDIVAIYVPLVQSISRVGCFFAGCCYGITSNVSWSMTYTDPNTAAPMNIPLHPTQLYSAIILAIIFLSMYLVIQKVAKRPGQLLATYLILSSTERFFVDFWRADRTYPDFTSTMPFTLMPNFFNQLSINQLIALLIIVTALLFLIYVTLFVPQKNDPAP